MLSRVGEHEAQGLVEYALILLLVALALIVILGVFGGELYDSYQYIIDQLPF